ncbi:RNA 2',3'-cyclic phosphodiesterase [Algoriphagus boritolerans]|nr:RNA 2',3'-cyclic phosphodiesterase [Algoriphagus boritolerans]
MQKYFLALLPPPEILEMAQDIKMLIRDQFGIKYALKSPPHITLKMPFSYNEAKESILEEKLARFLEAQKPFEVKIAGVGTFGNRVIFLGIEKSTELMAMQSSVKTFCKRELNLVDELSDRNYHPHLTVSFKDLKPGNFFEVLELVRQQSFRAYFNAGEITILKRLNQKWIPYRNLPFGG